MLPQGNHSLGDSFPWGLIALEKHSPRESCPWRIIPWGIIPLGIILLGIIPTPQLANIHEIHETLLHPINFPKKSKKD